MILFGATGIASLDTSKNPPATKKAGKAGVAYTPTRVPVSFQYAVADIGDIIPSHLLEGNRLVENTAFRMAGGVQPRDRGRLGSYAYIMEQAKNLIPDFLLESADVDSGAPMIGPNQTIEAGNGRWPILATAYELGKGGIYKRELISRSKQYGLDPKAVGQIESPILVRMRTTPIDIQSFAEAANISRTLRQSPSEIAVQDARKLTPSLLSKFAPSETGEIHSRANRAFVQGFMELVPAADRGELTTASGELSDLGLRRIRNALMQKAYNDPDIVVRIAESLDDNAKNLTSALVRLAPRYAEAQQRIASGDMFPALDISKDLVAAIRVFSRLKDERTDLQDYLAQLTIFGRELTPEQEELLKLFWAFSRSSRKVGDFLSKYLDLAEDHGSPKQMGFLSKPISKLETLREASRKIEDAGIDPTASAPASISPPPMSRAPSPLPPTTPAIEIISPRGRQERRKKEPVAIATAAPEATPMAPGSVHPSELWAEAKPETWPTRKPEKAIEEARQGGTQAYFVEGPKGGYRGVVMLSDVETFLKIHPTLRLKPIYK